MVTDDAGAERQGSDTKRRAVPDASAAIVNVCVSASMTAGPSRCTFGGRSSPARRRLWLSLPAST